MPIQIDEVSMALLDEYSRIPIRFEARSIFDVELLDNGLGGIKLVEKKIGSFVKDYDVNEKPSDWPKIFDVKNWGFFLAHDENQNVGAAAVAFNTNGVHMLEERSDLAVLWDIRVRPEVRGRGVGKTLFEHAAHWSRQRGCRHMKIETQNINVPACRFYQHMGCELGVIHRFAYAEFPNEVMLNWYLTL